MLGFTAFTPTYVLFGSGLVGLFGTARKKYWRIKTTESIMLRTLFSALLLLCVTTTTWADFEKGEKAYNRKDYATALKEFRMEAMQGSAVAQASLGLMYDRGHGVPQDYAEAVKWYRKAAEQGLAVAQSKLGVMYADGQGVSQDYAEAVKWNRKAAEQGLARVGWVERSDTHRLS